MSSRRKYEKLVSLFRKAYENKSAKDVQEMLHKVWRLVKGDSVLYDALVLKLKDKINRGLKRAQQI